MATICLSWFVQIVTTNPTLLRKKTISERKKKREKERERERKKKKKKKEKEKGKIFSKKKINKKKKM